MKSGQCGSKSSRFGCRYSGAGVGVGIEFRVFGCRTQTLTQTAKTVVRVNYSRAPRLISRVSSTAVNGVELIEPAGSPSGGETSTL